MTEMRTGRLLLRELDPDSESNAGSLAVLDRLGFERVKIRELQTGGEQLLLLSLELGG